ncbi:hypothetical protein CSA17_07300 [bacterium DOLJORAL78_65_58]|nr:MAG: hypothetical protein CSA17_07300 [bacterium DOLJORAL78_65_58]
MILYRDDNWLAVDKPEGLATHAGKPGELGVVEWLRLHHGLETHVISRLDRGTSGVLLLARTAAASARAQEIHEQGLALKTYHFLTPEQPVADSWVCDPGRWPVRRGTLRTPLPALPAGGLARVDGLPDQRRPPILQRPGHRRKPKSGPVP